MKRNWAVCAGGLLLVVFLGCKSLNSAGLFGFQDAAGQETVVAGSLDLVAQSAQSKMTQLGFAAVSTKEGDTIRIECKNNAGLRFWVVLTRQPAEANGGTERTNVRFEWQDQRDNQIALQLVGHLDSSKQR
jgi:hypothetical protein